MCPWHKRNTILYLRGSLSDPEFLLKMFCFFLKSSDLLLFFCLFSFYSSPYSLATNRMIAQTSITPFIAASPVSTYQVGRSWLLERSVAGGGRRRRLQSSVRSSRLPRCFSSCVRWHLFCGWRTQQASLWKPQKNKSFKIKTKKKKRKAGSRRRKRRPSSIKVSGKN